MNFINLSMKGMSKKIKLYIIFLIITIVMFTLLLFLFLSFKDYYLNKVKSEISNRVLYCSSENAINIFDIKSIAQVEEIYCKMNSLSADYEENYTFNLEYKSNEEIEEIIGEPVQSNGEYSIILPEKIVDKSGKIYYTTDLAGQKIEIKVLGEYFDVYVKNVYDDYTSSNTVYINDILLEKLYTIDNNVLDENIAFILLDSYNSVDIIIEELQEKGDSCNLYDVSGENDVNILNMTFFILKILIFTVVVFNIIFVTIMINSMISDEKKYIAIMKAIGFKNGQISTIIANRISIVITISALISYVILLISFELIMKLIQKYIDVNVLFNSNILNLIFFAIYILLIIIAITLTLFNKNKIKKISPIELLKE